jgi:hypothetical protein
MTQSHEQTPDDAEEAPPTATQLLRHALVNDDDPRFPWWLLIPGLALVLLWAGYHTASAAAAGLTSDPRAEFLAMLVWPGAPIFLLSTVATWLGWQLELD